MAVWNYMHPLISPASQWALDPTAAVALQKKLAASIVCQPFRKTSFTIAGIDTGYRGKLARAAVVLMRFPELDVIETRVAQGKVRYSYRTGLLAFREGPIVLDALDRLGTRPNMLLFDGQGLAHPRRFGLACHIGLLTDTPAIGCAKSHLVGRFRLPGPDRGCFSLLTAGQERIGAVVRTRSHVKPVFVSVGFKTELRDCIRIVLACCRGYRLPEPIRRAHREAAFH